MHVLAAELTPRRPALVEEEIDGVVLVGMRDVRDELADLDVDVEPLLHLAAQRGCIALSLLDASSRELPEQRQHGVGPTLRDEVAAVSLDDGGDDPNGAARVVLVRLDHDVGPGASGGRGALGYITSVRLLYFGLPLGAEVLRRHGFTPCVAAFGHRMPGLRRARARLAPTVLDEGATRTVAGVTERPLVLFKPDLEAPSILATLASARPDVILSWFWPTRIPETVLRLAPRGAFGVHPSLLPRHRGPDPYFHAIHQGDAETGVTLHRLEAAYDTGHIVAQRHVAIGEDDDAWRLARKLDRPSLALLLECAERLTRGETLEGTPQDEALATEAPQPDEELLCIDWDQSAPEVLRLVRAAAPSPMVSTLLGDELIFVRRAALYAGDVPDVLEPGDAWRVPEGIVVVCGEGALLLVDVEREDGERVKGRAIDALVPSA